MQKRLFIVMLCCALSQTLYAQSSVVTVKGFVAAFNAKDIEGMLQLANTDIQWMSVSGQTIVSEASSQEALRKAMTGYFAGVPSARSEIRTIHQSGAFVFALEEAFWTSNGVEKSQCSMAVYELTGAKIKHVWYFPAHACS